MMRVLGWVGLFAVAAVVATAVAARFHDGPLGPFPGGALVGEPESSEEPDWTFLREVDSVELQLDPESPRSVRTWVAELDGTPYVPSLFAAWKRWPAQVEADGRVVMRAAGRLYARRAVRVGDASEYAAAARAVAEKYGTEPEADPERVWFFRLDPPPPSSR